MAGDLEQVGQVLNDGKRPMKERFRALFTLRNLGGREAIGEISRVFSDPSALLKHEAAYCLGQMCDLDAVPVLTRLLEDVKVEAIVRHEAGEALGAIGDPNSLAVLEKFAANDDDEEVVRHTCQLAVKRIEWTLNKEEQQKKKLLSDNPYNSVDPAPPSVEQDVEALKKTLLDDQQDLFKRYRAMFALRNKGDDISIMALATGLKCQNALFRHEIAYVLGQIQSGLVADQLVECLRNTDEMDMVRHECAEALGSIGTEEINEELAKYLDKSQPPVLRESCEVALDFSDHNATNSFQYANTLSTVKS